MSELENLWDEIDKLRAVLAKGEKDCIYCGLPAKDINKCSYGFPGCSRMDDIMCGPESKAEQENIDLRLQISSLKSKIVELEMER